jgi:hypothetical protein
MVQILYNVSEYEIYHFNEGEGPGEEVSISPTFYMQLFRTEVSRNTFLYLHFRFEFFWRKNILAIAAHKMFVKLSLRGERRVVDCTGFALPTAIHPWSTWMSSRAQLLKFCLGLQWQVSIRRKKELNQTLNQNFRLKYNTQTLRVWVNLYTKWPIWPRYLFVITECSL